MKVTAIKTPVKIRVISLEFSLLKSLELMIFDTQQVTQNKFDYVKANNPLLLVAYAGNKPIGFKLGYVIPTTKIFFSWLGGIHPDFRRQGIASELLERQETSALEMDMETIYFTTYDRFPAMINLGKKNQYEMTKSEPDNGETKYWYEKSLC